MLINIYCAKCIGIQAVPVNVEVDINSGIGIHLVGLADIAVKESLLRIMTALQSLGFHIPGKKIVINLAPADMHKNGSGYDLPIALGIIAASGQRNLPALTRYIIMGELGLDASVRPVAGAIPIAEFSAKMGLDGCILPKESAMEASELQGIKVFGVSTLTDVLRVLEDPDSAEDLLTKPVTNDEKVQYSYMDFADIVGQEEAKRGLEIAAAGGHNAIMIGSPGSGKTSMAKAMIGIMPQMTTEEAIETSKIYSVAGQHHISRGLIRERPFRAPHYSASLAAIIGGGNGDNILPGEVSLAENGILFLDEMSLLPKSVMEALRSPLEDRKVTISRLRSKVDYPASFMLVAASNPCPCGYFGIRGRCSCTPAQRQSYISRLSGPIMDRIDIQLTVNPVPPSKLVHKQRAETSSAIAARVRVAREIQACRFAGCSIHVNAEMSGEMTDRFCNLTDECKVLIEELANRLGLSARAFTRILKLSRTIADLEVAREICEKQDMVSDEGFIKRQLANDCSWPHIQPRHIMEAVGYRFLDRMNMMM